MGRNPANTNQLTSEQDPSNDLSSIMQPGCDAVHGRGKGAVDFLVDVSTALPAQQFDLNQAERVHVRVTQLNGARQNGTALQERTTGATRSQTDLRT